MLLYFRFHICNGGKFNTLTVFNYERTAIIDFDTFLRNRFRSSCLCMFLFIHSFRLSLPCNSPCRSRKNDCIHCLSSRTFWSLSCLSKLSPYLNKIFIENSFCVVLSKLQRVKLYSKSKRRHASAPSLLRNHFKEFFETAATIVKPYTTHSGGIY